MSNRPLYALWIIAGAGAIVGFVLIGSGPRRAVFGPDDYTPVFIGSGLVSLAVMCAVGALIAMAVGWYVQHPHADGAYDGPPPKPKKRTDLRGESGEPFLGGRHD